MRRLVPLALAIAVLCLSSAGCRRHRKTATTSADVENFSTISASDPRASSKFVSGFYPIEDGSWRWTQRNFSVLLHPPLGADKKGAQLVLHFAAPDAILKQLKSLTLSASIAGHGLSPETYTSAGQATYKRDIPADQLSGANVTVDFSLDKALPPSAVDQRELGVIVSSVGFEAK